jgi:hypothetical protein
MPPALRVFLWSLFSGLVSGAFAFRAILFFATRWAGEDEYRQMLAVFLSIVGALAVGVSGAVTAGVMAGKRQKST